MSRIKIEKVEVYLFTKLAWPEKNEFVVTHLTKFEVALGPFIKILK